MTPEQEFHELTGGCWHEHNNPTYVELNYILNPSTLLQKAIEFLKENKK